MKRSTPAKAFTLIELLVVVAVIGLLAAILFPVFARVRENARRTSCQNNLKQMSLGMTQYLQDYDERYPIGGYVTPQFKLFTPLDAIQPYLKNRQVSICISDSTPYDIDFGPLGVGEGYSYSTNDLICNSPDFGGTAPVSTAQITEPTAQLPLIWDSRNAKVFDPGNAGGTLDLRVARRHFDGANCAFVDGHVKFIVNTPPLADFNPPSDARDYWNAPPFQPYP